MQTIWYRVIDHCEERYYDIELPDTYNLARPMEQTLIAAQCAEDYHSNHDGWESNWPLTFALHGTEEGQEVARLNIDREAVPHFYASHVKPPNANVTGLAPRKVESPNAQGDARPKDVASTAGLGGDTGGK